jgi:MFS family permease
MVAETTTNKGIKDALAVPNFRRLWSGQTISQIGDGLTSLAILIMINQLTHSTTALATMMIVLAVPQLVLGLLAGVYVDRWNRRTIMIVSDVIRGLLVLGFILVRRPQDVWIFYLLGFVQAGIGTFFDPAKSALIPTIVERDTLLAANGLSQTTRVITGVVGSALAGVLVGATHSAWTAFSIDSLSFFISALFISRILMPTTSVVAGPSGAAPRTGLRSVLSQLGEGLRYLFGSRLLVGIMVTLAMVMLGMGAVNVLIVPFLLNTLHVPTMALGVIDTAQVIGMILGGGGMTALAARLKSTSIIIFGVILLGVFVGMFGGAGNIWLALAALFLVGLALAPVQAALATLLQTTIPDDKRGRANSTMNTVITLTSGLLGDWLGVRQVFFLSGGLTILAGVVAAMLIRSPRALLPGAQALALDE